VIVPDYWAEARKQHRDGGKQVTVQRLGWSTVSESDALAMAEARVAEAIDRILSGDTLHKREGKTAYNGAFGVPIREEVISRHGEEVITRNSYGARCLNTPRALFADIDFPSPNSGPAMLAGIVLSALLAALAGWYFQRWDAAIGVLFLSFLVVPRLLAFLLRLMTAKKDEPAQIARQRILDFLRFHPAWSLRLYQTPGGLRLLATHRLFTATEPEVREFFEAVGTDPIYTRMCVNQNCFRARLTAKPWRIGISSHLRPRGAWPVPPDSLPLRTEWVTEYEKVASIYAACHFVESLGSGVAHKDLEAVIALHDQESHANNPAMPIA